ncbi:MAG: hypothetical protein DRQ57_15440 [Gammaproteobacteria bacterium]|nr:MAG: hypothetical protein DRQ57_15440 [Gammaproteobacteria bacterium]
MKIHHIGYVVKNIDKYKQNLIIKKSIKKVYDKIQKAELELIQADNILIELIEPQDKSAFTYNFLKNGGGYHHLCYEVNSLDEAFDIIKKNRMIKVLEPMYAVLLDAYVVFAYNRNKEMTEFVICQKK